MYISESAVHYGNPHRSTSSYVLSGHSGLPFVLTYYRLRFSVAIRKILFLGQDDTTPKGIFIDLYTLVLFIFLLISLLFSCQETFVDIILSAWQAIVFWKGPRS